MATKSCKKTGTNIYKVKNFKHIRSFLYKVFHEADFNEQKFTSTELRISRRTFYNIKKILNYI